MKKEATASGFSEGICSTLLWSFRAKSVEEEEEEFEEGRFRIMVMDGVEKLPHASPSIMLVN